MNELLELNSERAYLARIGAKLGKSTYLVLISLSLMLLILSLFTAVFLGIKLACFVAAPIAILFCPAVWWKRELSILPVKKDGLTQRLSVDVLSRLQPGSEITSGKLWASLNKHWQAAFITNHLLLDRRAVEVSLEAGTSDEANLALQYAVQIADHNGSRQIELGNVITGLLYASAGIRQLIISYKADPAEIVATGNWLARNIHEHASVEKRFYGGIGRDWAFGYTPLLNRFGQNVTLAITDHGAHFGSLLNSASVKAMEAAFDNHANTIALVGPLGIGKSSSVYAFAQRLIEGKTSSELAYHQIVSINATDITAFATQPGELEHIMISLANEAAHAGHIILFLDDAESFMNDAPGAFNASQILQSILQSKTTPMILALSPHGYERLKATNQTLASLITPVVMQELPRSQVMEVLEDTAVTLENKNHVIIAYEALTEAYNLSERYDQDEAFPGKATKLLEQSIAHSNQNVVSAKSVQDAVEQTKGVKVASAAPAEADELLNLEDKIHERMINQTHAVSVVANSLRRARAGVKNPRRPIGSFLFLGPTGVGKTELARSLAATYFGAESNMIRLDMTEYQQESDVSRLLSDGGNETKSLIMAERQQPFSVVLLDEIEKAHPNILNLLLQLLDEGQLTDISGRAVSFKDSIIIATSNAGAQTIRENVEKGVVLEALESALLDELIKTGAFKPELINRFDEVVLFRPLNEGELTQVVGVMLKEINVTLSQQNISVALTKEAIEKIVRVGYDPRLGARPMRRTLQKAVEDTIAQKILRNQVKPGEHLLLDVGDLSI